MQTRTSRLREVRVWVLKNIARRRENKYFIAPPHKSNHSAEAK